MKKKCRATKDLTTQEDDISITVNKNCKNIKIFIGYYRPKEELTE